MLEAWRIVKTKHARTAFSGEGAAKAGGRWNSPGIRVVYTSATCSLAVLETLVHLNPPIHFRFSIFHLRFPESMVEFFPLAELPRNWRSEPPPPSTKRIGTEWIRQNRSAILALPSIIVPEE